MAKSVKQIFWQLQNEGYKIDLIDYSKEDDNEYWVAYAINQNAEQVEKIKKTLKDTGMLQEPANDIIEPFEELYTSLKNLYRMSKGDKDNVI
jgi:hypothetical protein